MKFKYAWKLIQKAIEEDNREKLYQLFLVEHKHRLYLMANGMKIELLTFNEFCEQLNNQQPIVDTRSTDEIMNDILGLKFKQEGS